MTDSDTADRRTRCVVAGAPSPVGRRLPERLGDTFELVGLASTAYDGDLPEYSPHEVRTYNPFSLEEAIEALGTAERIVYLARHRRPVGQWVQGAQQTLDSLAALNIATAAEEVGAEKLVVLATGLDVAARDPSNHLQAICELSESARTGVDVFVADALVGTDTLVADLARAVAGRRRLPRCPAWTREHRCFVSVGDAARAVARSVSREPAERKRFRLEPPADTTARQLLAGALDTERADQLRDARGAWPRLSAWRLARISGYNMDRMRSAVELFRTGAAKNLSVDGEIRTDTPVEESLRDTLDRDRPPAETSSATRNLPVVGSRTTGVYSLQRLPNPSNATGEELADEYFGWLHESSVGWFVRVERDDGRTGMFLRGTGVPLLILELDPNSSSGGRATYRVVGGKLATGDGRAYFEFRPLPHVHEFIVALRNFRTVLPWLFYRWTQGIFHAWVMKAFGRHMSRIEKSDDASHY